MTDQMTAYEKNSHVSGVGTLWSFMRECVTTRQIAATHTTVSPMRIKIDKLIFFLSFHSTRLSLSLRLCIPLFDEHMRAIRWRLWVSKRRHAIGKYTRSDSRIKANNVLKIKINYIIVKVWFRLLSSRISFTVDIANPTTTCNIKANLFAFYMYRGASRRQTGNFNAYPISDMKWRKRNFLLCWLVVGARFKRFSLCVYDCLESINYISITSSPSSHLFFHYPPCLSQRSNTRCVRAEEKIIWNWINSNRIIIIISCFFLFSSISIYRMSIWKNTSWAGLHMVCWFGTTVRHYVLHQMRMCAGKWISHRKHLWLQFCRWNYDPHLLLRCV